ncbi:glutamate receptor 2.8-like protein [Tanacetum coccineum]
MWIIDGVLRHPADSHAWRTIDGKFPKITEDPRNLRLGISADGVDVNTGNRHHSVLNVALPRKQKKAFNGQQEFLPALIPMIGEQIYNEVQHIENKRGKGKRTNNKASKNQEDMRGKEKNVAESLVGTLLHVPGKTKDGVNARLDMAELGGQTRVVCYARRRQNNTTSSRLHIDEC